MNELCINQISCLVYFMQILFATLVKLVVPTSLDLHITSLILDMHLGRASSIMRSALLTEARLQ